MIGRLSRFWLVVLFSMASLMLGACNRASNPGVESIVIGTTDRASQLDPAASYDAHTWEIHYNTMGGLLMMTPTGEPLPALARSWPEVSDDGLTWTLTLKHGLRFPSGRELTAQDVVWSIERARSLGGDPSWMVTSFVDRIEAPDPKTVRFTLLKPTTFFPHLLTVPIYFPLDSTCYVADAIADDTTCGGLGRYVISSWNRDHELVLEANPGWPGEPARAKSVIIRYFDSSEAMAQALVAGEIDLLWGALLPEKLDLLRHNPALKVWSGPSAFKRNLILLHSEPALAQREVREALNLLIDREAISTSVYEGAFKALYSPIPMGIHGHHEVMPHTDVARAGELLGAAGHGEARPLALDLWWARDHYGDQEQLLAQTLKSQLEVNGMVQVRLHEAPWSEYNVASADCHYPAFLLGWQPDYLDLSTSVDFFALSTATPDLCSNYANPAMDELILAAQTEAHPERRLALYRDIQQLWARDIPTIPLVQGTVNAASIGALDGVHIDPLGLLHYESLHK